MKHLFAILLIASTSLSCYAQETSKIDSADINPLWLSMPESVCPSISFSDVLPEESTAEYFSASITTASTIQMRVVPAAQGELLCVVKTFMSPAADSEVIFYDKEWNRVGQQNITLEDVIPSDSLVGKNITAKRLRALLKPLLISAQLNSSTTDLLLTINPVMLSEDEKSELKDLVLQRTLKWDGEKFK